MGFKNYISLAQSIKTDNEYNSFINMIVNDNFITDDQYYDLKQLALHYYYFNQAGIIC